MKIYQQISGELNVIGAGGVTQEFEKRIEELEKSDEEILNRISDAENSTPIGTVISFIGTNSPDGYLNCDGGIHNINAYLQLAEHFRTNFGSVNYFGGDGTTTFAVPDLRGEFLRGSGTAARNTGTGAEVGVHQDPTNVPYIFDSPSAETIFMKSDLGYGNYISNGDSYKGVDTPVKLYQIMPDAVYGDNISDRISATIRPTNTAVMYCIKAKNQERSVM